MRTNLVPQCRLFGLAVGVALCACAPATQQVRPRSLEIAALKSPEASPSAALKAHNLPPTTPPVYPNLDSELNPRTWLDKRTVKLVVFDFYEEGCQVCKAAGPKWKALQNAYKPRELVVIAINITPQSGPICPQLRWNPDKTLCMPGLARRFGVDKAPATFVWSWQGDLLVNHERRVDEAEREIRRYMNNLPRVQVFATGSDDMSGKLLQRHIEEALLDESKLQLLTDPEMRQHLAMLRKKSHAPKHRGDQKLTPGVTLSANSILKAELHSNTLTLLLDDALSDRRIAIHSVPWAAATNQQNIQSAVATLLTKLKHEPIEMPADTRPPLRELKTGEITFLKALSLDFRQKRYGQAQDIERLYAEACEQKVGAACIFKDWHFNSGGHFAKALKVLRPRCQSDDPLACIVVGWALSQVEPKGTPSKAGKNPRGAADVFSQACDMGVSLGCVELGRLQLLGAGVPRDEASALDNFQRTCAHDGGRGCLSLAWMYQNGRAVERDLGKALEYAEKACQSNVPEGCAMAGLAYFRGEGVSKDYSQALQRFISACESGFALGCTNAGRLYEGRDGTDEDGKVSLNLSEAVKWLTRGCSDLHDSKSCTNLGKTLCNPEGEKRPDDACDKVESLLSRACKKGNVAHACLELAKLYETGRVTVSDPARTRSFFALASRLFKTRCEQGGAKACLQSAALLKKGAPGVPMDRDRAEALRTRACKLGVKDEVCSTEP
jgi:uncharacterized protein